MFQGGLVAGNRSAMPYLERGSALLLIVAGILIVYYWLCKGGLIETFSQELIE